MNELAPRPIWFWFGFFLLGEIKDIFSFVLFSPKEKKRKDNYRYLKQ